MYYYLSTRSSGRSLYSPVKHVPPGRNTSLWITGLRSNVTCNALLKGVRKAGRVKHTHIYRPDAKNPTSCAAKLTFFSREAAERLYDQAMMGKFCVQGIRPAVLWNRSRTANEPVRARSRVLRIQGPPEIVNKGFLEDFWAMFLYWATDEVVDVGEIADGVAVVWYSFGSWSAQAAVARRALLACYGGSITVTCEADPCEQ
ncbi:hypothetical protein GGR50DRAFT_696238 [Xylaria sp. CBS 124048]|nr:hypothetical protein GGR50DRAFT_696238 [Xylaria sp. CBS 124048]